MLGILSVDLGKKQSQFGGGFYWGKIANIAPPEVYPASGEEFNK
jgi:hypothetical protein